MRNSGKRQHHKGHDEINQAAINHAGQKRTPSDRGKLQCGEKKYSRPGQGDRVMNGEAERDRALAALERFHADQSAGDILKHAPGRNSAEMVEDKVFRYVQGPGR